MALPPAGFTQTIEKTAYIAARKAASSRTGALRFRLPMLLLSAAAATGAAVTVLRAPTSIGAWMAAVCLLLLSAVIAGVWLYVLPARVARCAEADFDVFDRLLNPAGVTLREDEFTMQTPCLTREQSYARLQLCIETPARFVLLTEEGSALILEKACFAEKERTTAFLRERFVRRYVKAANRE